MKLRILISIMMVGLLSCGDRDEDTFRTISLDELKDKIAGGWAGKMIGVSYGAPTEFRALGETYEDPIDWAPENVRNSIGQDDIYVQLSFMMAMDEYGLDAPADKLAESYVKAGYKLWHANAQGRKNYMDGLRPPETGHPDYNLHADDIDFQIESDYLGFMCPAMPATATRMADKVGHIMNYGDGVYGGIFVAALYASAYFQDDIPTVVEEALASLPYESEYAECIRDVIKLHKHYPDNWRDAWVEFEAKWGEVDICKPFNPFNIDAKLNGAYIVMGLLYGEGDFSKTIEIATRCGQDSDCNPSNAAAVIGIMNGYSAIPDKWKSGIDDIANENFVFTNYNFNTAVDRTLEYTKQLVLENGGEVSDTQIKIKPQSPEPPELEVAFPNVVASHTVSIFDEDWQLEGEWDTFEITRDEEATPYLKYASDSGNVATLTFEGAGIALDGAWRKDAGLADFYIDGELHRTADTYYWYADQEKLNDAYLWHVFGLEPGEHTVKVAVKGDKRDISEGTNVYLKRALIFNAGDRKNVGFKFSFE